MERISVTIGFERWIAIVVSLLALSLASRADWTRDLPSSGGSWDILTPTRSGVIAYQYVRDPGSGNIASTRLLWYSPAGDLLLDYTAVFADFTEFYSENIIVLNDRQVFLQGDRGTKARLISVVAAGKFETRDYTFDSGQVASRFSRYQGNADYSGFYILDKGKSTIARVVFPDAAGPASAKVVLQSSVSPVGPWSAFGETSVPADASQEFFRLEIRR